METDEGGVALSRYTADRVGKRPAVSSCTAVAAWNSALVPMSATRTRTRWPLVASAYLVRYFMAIDYQGLDPEKSTRESRDAYTTKRFDEWTKRI